MIAARASPPTQGPAQGIAAVAAQDAAASRHHQAVPARSCSGTTAHGSTIVKAIAARPTHQPTPAGPAEMPVASVRPAATSGPSGTAAAQAESVSRPASQPQARNRPL